MTTGRSALRPRPSRGDRDGRPRLIIAGAGGRLGRAVVNIAVSQGFPIVAAVDRLASPRTGTMPEVQRISGPRLADLLGEADVFATATTPAAERANLPIVARSGVAAVVATTGIGTPSPAWLRACGRRIPIAMDSNFSLGMAILRRAVRSIGPLPDGFDVSIVEAHRREKSDHPSGTARTIVADLSSSGVRGWHEAIGERTSGQVEIASLRGGETPGVHAVQIAGRSELLRFEHVAFGREAFAEGMLLAAQWLFERRRRLRPGFYTLDDALSGGTA
jgi:4-hydroxy-tetrahydrodipicolinate reductase